MPLKIPTYIFYVHKPIQHRTQELKECQRFELCLETTLSLTELEEPGEEGVWGGDGTETHLYDFTRQHLRDQLCEQNRTW